MAFSGILNAVSNVVPYALVGEMVPKAESGLYVGVLNMTQVSAQLLSNFLASTMMSVFGNVTSGMGTMAHCVCERERIWLAFFTHSFIH